MEETTVATYSMGTHKGRPSRVTEMQIGDTLFTVVSVQSEYAKESAYDKVKKLILDHARESPTEVSESLHIIA